MSYLGTGLVLLAVLAGGGHPGPTPTPTPTPTSTAPAPESVSASPVLTEGPSGAWSTTIYLNTAALCANGSQASFSLVTTSPGRLVTISPAKPAALDPSPGCGTRRQPAGWNAWVSAHPLTQVTLSFGPAGMPATPPVTAAVVVMPPTSPASPVQVTLTVHRQVSWIQYLWVPVWCGAGLDLLFIAALLTFGLRDPGGSGTIRGRKILDRPLYAASAWTFSGSWATNLTAAGAITAAILTASGTVGEVLPGVETGRFGLLIAAAGAVTAIAPLIFGALSYSSLRADPTTTGVSVIELPDRDEPRRPGATGAPNASIQVPAGATITLSGGATTDTPGVTLDPGEALAVPPGATMSVTAAAGARRKVLALPGSTDIAVFDGQQITISPTAITVIKDPTPVATLTVRGGAKISFLGQARLRLPEGTAITAPNQERPAAAASLGTDTPYILPRTGESIACRMLPLLFASFFTLLGTGAELGILAVLACWLSSADSVVRWISGVSIALTAVVVLYYGVISIRALADPVPGDALNAAGGSSFIL